MSGITLFLVAAGLSMDAFAVSVCKGLALPSYRSAHSFLCGLWFGGFQGLMPLIGFLLGIRFAGLIVSFDHWIAFFMLGIIGFGMIKTALGKSEKADPSFAPAVMIVLALATSIDALAIGITFAFLEVNIISAVISIFICTFIISAAGVKIGAVFGEKYRSGAELLGGMILVILGIKILVEHIFFK